MVLNFVKVYAEILPAVSAFPVKLSIRVMRLTSVSVPVSVLESPPEVSLPPPEVSSVEVLIPLSEWVLSILHKIILEYVTPVRYNDCNSVAQVLLLMK